MNINKYKEKWLEPSVAEMIKKGIFLDFDFNDDRRIYVPSIARTEKCHRAGFLLKNKNF